MLKIGWASRSFTPDRPAMLQGQMHTRVARTAMDPLTLTAMAIEGGAPADCAIMISCDLPFVSDELVAEVRRRLGKSISPAAADRTIMCATHTHTSLVTEDVFYPFPGGDVMHPDDARALIVERAVQAGEEAWKSRAPRSFARAFGHAVVGHNRRAVYRDGNAVMYGSTNRPEFDWIEGYEDHSLDMLFTWDASGALAGILLCVPCPSQVDEGIEQFSADYWHEIRTELRSRFGKGLNVLGLCGAAGDQSPHFMLYGQQEEEMRRRRGVTERQEIAQRVADAVSRALACTKPVTDDVPFAHVIKKADLPPRGVSRAERDWAKAEHDRVIPSMPRDSWWPAHLRAVVDQYEGKLRPPPFPLELHVLRIGDMVLATNPFELFVDYGLRMKARSPATQTFIVQLAAGVGWYLPTERAVQGGGYGAMPAVCKVGPEGGRQLVELTMDTIRALFA